GDTIAAAALTKMCNDSHNQTYVRYEMLVNKFARQRNRASRYELKTYFGQLQKIIVVHIPPTPLLCLTDPTTAIFAVIKPCEIESHNSLGNSYYSKLGSIIVMDITCLQCIVGRIPVGTQWALIDRSGNLARVIYDESDVEQ
ncbi:hypothetical protein SERLA73DRAFT_48831, partial [Serpula lacrymans var. lacrymans S7.3]